MVLLLRGVTFRGEYLLPAASLCCGCVPCLSRLASWFSFRYLRSGQVLLSAGMFGHQHAHTHTHVVTTHTKDTPTRNNKCITNIHTTHNEFVNQIGNIGTTLNTICKTQTAAKL